jgi:hypothetical protein
MVGATVSAPLPMRPVYVTTDLHLASFLYFRGAALVTSKRLRPKVYSFGFAADRELHDLVRLYWSGALTPVVPSLLLETPLKLKVALGRGKQPPTAPAADPHIESAGHAAGDAAPVSPDPA